MSGFAALTGFDGDSSDVLAAQKKKEAARTQARAAEAAVTLARFEELKASAGATNWADSDEDDDAFFGKPPGLGPPGLKVRGTRRRSFAAHHPPATPPRPARPRRPLPHPSHRAQSGDGAGDDDEDDESEESGDESEGEPSVLAPGPISEADLVPKQRKKKAPDAEQEAVDALLASLEVTESKEATEDAGQSKAAQKRAKKKLADAAAKANGDAPAAEAEAPAVAEEEDAGVGKSPEEVKAMLAAKVAAAKKAKDKKKAAGGSAAAAAAKAGAGEKTKKAKDKTHYNQMPC